MKTKIIKIVETYMSELYILSEGEHISLVIELKKVPKNIQELATVLNLVQWDVINENDLGQTKLLNTYSVEFNFEKCLYENVNLV